MTTIARISLALFVLLIALVPVSAQERVLTFISDVKVQRSGDFDVTETIRVQVEGKEIRRGILRDFPTSYTARDGSRMRVGFTVLGVRRDGQTEFYRLEGLANGVRIRIGSASRFLTHGPHEYVIRYRTTRQLGFFKNFDELYWNATGTGWTFAIDQAEARITLPQEVPFKQSAFYTGPQGARGKDAEIVSQRPGHIVFRTTKPLPRYNGLTVAAGWQKGIVTEPSQAQKAEWWWQDNRVIVTTGSGFALLLAFYALGWMVVGRDPPRGTIIPLFAPPDDMPPAAVRFMHEMGSDYRTFSATIINLAVKGHLKIVDKDGERELHRLSGGKPIDPVEQAALTKLFKQGRTLELDNSNHETVQGAIQAVDKALEKNYLGKQFANNYGWSVTGFLVSVAFIVAIAVMISFSYGQSTYGKYLFAMFLPMLPVLGGLGQFFTALEGGRVRVGRLLWGVALTAIFGGIGIYFMSANSRGWIEVLPGIIAWVILPIALWGFQWMKAPSVAGRAIMDKIDGFKQYLEVAEEDRLEYLHPPKKTPELFERLLPYAVALGVENSWAQKFTAVLAAAGTAAATTSWYVSDRDSGRDPVSFANSVGSQLTTTITSASTPPGSSSSGGGSSGGGSSGGGGGGGGGSGW